MSIELPNMPETLKGRYSVFSCEDSERTFRISEVNDLNRMPIKVFETSTDAFKIFAQEFNSIMLTTHLFENLLMLEDVRHDENGYDCFQIEIPKKYFRYPALNDPRNYIGTHLPDMNNDEIQEISGVISRSKELINCGNDESFVKNNLHKLEFISIFSFLESFIENLQVEILGRSQDEASRALRYEALSDSMEKTFNEINPDINLFLNKVFNNFFGFIRFSYRLRNLHSHNLGKATERFIKICDKDNLLQDDYGILDNGEKITFGKCVSFVGYRTKITLGKYISLSGMTFSFRNYARECVFIVEQYCQNRIRI